MNAARIAMLAIVASLAIGGAPIRTAVAAEATAPAASTQLGGEIQAVNADVARKAYADAIPHAERAAALARGDSGVSVAQRIELLTLLAQLYYYGADYGAAERVMREALELHRSSNDNIHATAVCEEDLAELLDLQGKFDAGAALHASAAAGLATTFRGDSPARSAVGRRDASASGDGPRIRERAYDFFDRAAGDREDGGYGRYTYVILAGKKDRGTALLATLLDAPAGAALSAANRAVVNAFEIPVQTGQRQDALAQSAPGADGTPQAKAERIWNHYDFAAANNLLLAACKMPTPATSQACHDVGAGPYLVTFTRAFNAFSTPPTPYLVVDLSNMQTPAFSYIVKTMQQQIEAADLTDIADGGAVHSMQTGLLNTVLVAADWITPIDDSVGKWVKVILQK